MTDQSDPARTRRGWRVRFEDGDTVELYTETAARLRAALTAERDPRAPAPIVERLGPDGWAEALRPEAAMLAVAQPGPTALVSGIAETDRTAKLAHRPGRFAGRPMHSTEGDHR